MKELLIRLFLGSLGFLFSYLLGSFYSVTFDMSNWIEPVRVITTLVGAFLTIILVTYPSYNFNNK